MRYQIVSLIYNAADGSLSDSASHESQTQLSLTANALLTFFLTHRAIVSREEVLKKVWDDNGLTASNNNLNQYISQLRKLFRHYGIDNIIVTISRGNLQLNPDLAITPLDAIETPDAPASEPDVPPSAMPASPPTANATAGETPGGAGDVGPLGKFHREGLCWYLGGVAMIVIAVLLILVALVGHPPFHTTHLVKLPYQNCELLVSEDMLNAVTQNHYGINFAAVKKRLHLGCQPGERFVFYYGDKLQTNGLGRVFLAHCAVKQNNDFSYCDNYFYYSWKVS